MFSKVFIMNAVIDCKAEEFQQCACKDCTRKGTRILRIKYINKVGHFCDLCAADLLSTEIAEGDNDVKSNGILIDRRKVT